MGVEWCVVALQCLYLWYFRICHKGVVACKCPCACSWLGLCSSGVLFAGGVSCFSVVKCCFAGGLGVSLRRHPVDYTRRGAVYS